jgi:hypothetical protein
MLCRVTNNQKGPRVIYNVNRRPVTIEPGQSVKIDIDEDTYETHRALSLAQVGPHIEIIEDDDPPQPSPPQPRPQPPQPQPIPPQPDDEGEDSGEDVLGEPPPHKPARKPRRTTRRAKRTPRGHASVQVE